MSLHDRPNGRPVHPACPANKRRRYEIPCTCHKLWDEWDGTDEEANKRLAVYIREYSRRRTYSNEDLQRYLETDSRKSWDGFWSKAENWLCVRGKNFLNGNFNYAKYRTGVWARVRLERQK